MDENNDLFLKVAGNEVFARYELNFLWAPSSIITDAEENPTPDGEYLPDFQGSKLTILGEEYTVLQATRPAGNASIQLVLMAGEKSDILLVEESKTFTVDNKEYAVEMISVNGNGVQFEVNGELVEIESDTVYGLNDGTPISANIFLAGDEPAITLFFNAEKMTLRDDDILDAASTHKVMIDDEVIGLAEIKIGGLVSSQKVEIDSIQIKMIAGNDYLVPENSKLSDVIEAAGDQKEVLMNGLLDIEYRGLNEEGSPLVYITGITTKTKKGLPLQVSTDEDAVCSYSLGEEYQEMEITVGTSHLQYLFDLVKGQDYEVSVQCVEEEEINTQSVHFHVADDVTPPQITITSPEDDSIVTSYLVSESIILSESWKIENGEDKLEIGESINDVITEIGSQEINALAENIWLVDGIEYNYEQSLSFDSEDAQNEIVTFAGDFNNNKAQVEELAEDGWKSGIYFQIKEDQQIAKYGLNFESPVSSEIDNADRLTDLQGTIFTLFDKVYLVSKAEKIYQHGVRLTLMDTSFNYVKYLELEDHDISDDTSTYYKDVQEGSLLEGESKTYTIDGQEYNVILVFTDSSNKALFNINGEPTPLMNMGDGIIISDGITLSLDDVLYQDYAGGVHQAEFSLKAIGSSKMRFNDQTIDGADVIIKGTINNGAASISSIGVEMVAQDDYYVAPGETLLEQPELENKNLLFAKNFDIKFDGLDPAVETDEISIKDRSGEREYWLTFTNNADQEIDFPLVYAIGGSEMRLGNKDDLFYLNNSEIADEGYFILNGDKTKDSVSHVVQYKGADDNAVSDPKMKFKILATGETVDRPVSFDSNGIATTSLKLSGVTYTIKSVGDTSKYDYNISVSGGMDTSSSNAYGLENYVIAKGGAKITITEGITDSNAKKINVDISLIDPNNVGDSVAASLEDPYPISSFDIIAVDTKVDFTNYAGIDLTSPANDQNNAYGYSANGAFVKLYSPVMVEHADSLVIDWPETQRLPQLYLTTTEAKYYTYYINLVAETDENAMCSYDLGDGHKIMSQTGGKNHYHALTGLEFGNNHEATIQCIDEAGNTNVQSTHFYLGEDTVPPKITFKSPPQDSVVKKEMLSEVTVYNTESWKIEKDGNVLEFGEPISNVTPVIGGNDLTALADNTWLINGNEYNYNQSLSFPVVNTYYNQKNGIVTYEEDDDDITDYFLLFSDNVPIATFKLEFISPAQSTMGDKILTNFQGTTLTLFGKEYYVFKAERPSQNNVKLTLMNNFVIDSVGKNETKTFSLSNVGYEITPTFMNEEYVQFKINGETTSMLKVGKTYLFLNGISFGVLEIKDGKVTFILGTEKLELQDKDITDDLSYEVKVNSETIDGAKIKIKGTDDNSVLSISSLEVKMTAQDDYYIGAGQTLLGQPELEEKDSLFTKNWDIKFDGFIGNDSQYPQVYITTATGTNTKPALPLELSTNENAVCSYGLEGEYQEMETTGAKVHSQNLFDLEDGKDYQVSVECIDESGNSNTGVLKFHFGEVAEEQPPQNQPSKSGGGGSSSSKKKDNSKDESLPIVEEETTNHVPDLKKMSEQPIQLSAEAPVETPNNPSFSNKLTAAVVGITEKGGLLYAAGLALIIFSLVGIKIYYSSKK